MSDENTGFDSRDLHQLINDVREGRAKASDIPRNLQGASLSNMNLAGMDLSGIDLSEADLTGANLSGAKLFKANLRGAILMRANLETAEMTCADLSGANLEDAQCKRAGLGMAILEGAHLFRCNLEETTLSLANFQDADLRNSNLRKARIREANLVNADLTNADLREADLSLSTVKGSTFTNADLREARLRLISGFEKATWIGVDIRDVNFAGAYRMRRNIIDQNFIKEFRAAGRLSAALYYLWWITSDCGRSMLRWCLWIMILSLFYAWLFTFVEIDYGEYRTWLSPFYYSVVTLTTLGYGDIMPASIGGQCIAMMEVISGYMMLGGLLSIFSNKIARRAD